MRSSFFLLFLLFFYGCQKKPAEPPRIRVEVAKAISQDVQDFVVAIGNIYEYSIVEVRPQAQGILLDVYVQQGDFVKKGDLLYKIDPTPYEEMVAEAEATLIRDRANYKIAKTTACRFSDAVSKDFIPVLQYEEYLANLDMATAQVELDQAALELAKINLGYCSIYATIDGKVGVYNIYPGNLVVVNDPNALIEIRQMSPIDIVFTVSQADLQEIQAHRTVNELEAEIFLPYEGNKKFVGKLYFLDNHVDTNSGMITLKASYDNKELALWPGQFIEVHLLTEMIKDALVIPKSAITFGQEGPYVYVVQKDMTVKAVNVEMGPRTDTTVVIKKGLEKGDEVVVNGQLNLRNGAKIEIIEAQAR